MRVLNIIFYLILGYIAIILAPISSMLKWLKNELIQELPPDEDTEFSERGRK